MRYSLTNWWLDTHWREAIWEAGAPSVGREAIREAGLKSSVGEGRLPTTNRHQDYCHICLCWFYWCRWWVNFWTSIYASKIQFVSGSLLAIKLKLLFSQRKFGNWEKGEQREAKLSKAVSSACSPRSEKKEAWHKSIQKSSEDGQYSVLCRL